MKTLQLITVSIILFAVSNTQAQVSINLNVGSPVVVAQPAWVPQNHANVDFYYIPEIQTYYDVNSAMYVYRNNGNWCRTRYVPVQYRNYNLNHAHRVALRGYHGNQPYAYYKNHNVRYYPSRNYNHRGYNPHRYADNYKAPNRNRGFKYDRHNRNERPERHHDHHDRKNRR